jgi:hypothetical protein
MAKATLVKPEPPKPNVLLELSYEEAKTLLTVTTLIGGNSQLSRRKHTDKIGKALINIGLGYEELDSVSKIARSIYFVDQEGI